MRAAARARVASAGQKAQGLPVRARIPGGNDAPAPERRLAVPGRDDAILRRQDVNRDWLFERCREVQA